MHAEKDGSALYIIQKLSDGSGLIPCKPTHPFDIEISLRKLHGEMVILFILIVITSILITVHNNLNRIYLCATWLHRDLTTIKHFANLIEKKI